METALSVLTLYILLAIILNSLFRVSITGSSSVVSCSPDDPDAVGSIVTNLLGFRIIAESAWPESGPGRKFRIQMKSARKGCPNLPKGSEFDDFQMRKKSDDPGTQIQRNAA
jgi:hypothetical protein